MIVTTEDTALIGQTVTITGEYSGKTYSKAFGENLTLTFKCVHDRYEVVCSDVVESVDVPAGETINMELKVYKQLVNYTMLYDGSLGEAGANGANACPDITGGLNTFKHGNYPDSSSVAEFLNNSIRIYSVSSMYHRNVFSNRKIDTTGYTKFAYRRCFSKVSPTTGFRIGFTNIQADSSNVYLPNPNTLVSSNGNTYYVSTDDERSLTNKVISIDIGDCEGYLHMYAANNSNGTTELSVNWISIFKPDDIVTLCQKARIQVPESLDVLKEDTDALSRIFSNKLAVDFMLMQCTGEFMFSIISNDVALGLLQASPYYTTVLANEHWTKFLAMIA